MVLYEGGGAARGFKRGLKVLAATAILIGIIVVGAVVVNHTKSSSSNANASNGTSVQVGYFVTGAATTANLTMQTASRTTQQNGVGVPDAQHLTMASGGFLYISAQNQGGSGDITCRIEVNGIQVASNTASGAYAIASCDGRA